MKRSSGEETTFPYSIKDGKITESWSFSQDQRLTDEFWS